MNIFLVILVGFMIGKDIIYLNDPLTPRGLAQGLCFLVGLFWLVANFSAAIIQKYLVIWLYLGVLFLTIFMAADRLAVAFQIGSLATMIIFFIAYYESRHYRSALVGDGRINNKPLINAIIFFYSIIAIGSLLMYKLDTARAYEVLYLGETRFRGILPKAAALGSSLGLFIGVAWFGWKRWSMKIIPVAIGVVGLSLTLSRTFWLAFIAALIITMWLYQPHKRKWLFAIVLLSSSAFIAVKGLDISINTKGVSSAVRMDSVEGLSGRTVLWEVGFNELKKSPLLGFGFTAGSNEVYKAWNKARGYVGPELGKNNTDKKRDTMHNGYIQAFMDSGYVGAFFYLLVIILALRKLNKWDTDRQYSVEMFSMVYLVISNFGECMIFSGSFFTSIMFWAMAIFSFSLVPIKSQKEPILSPAHV